MKWNAQFTPDAPPAPEEIKNYIACDLWQTLCTNLEQTYAVSPSVEYSRCSCAPGWNVKYKKGSKALCTLYPAQGYFTCLVSVSAKNAMEAELLLGSCSAYVRELYWAVKPFNGARWLMIDVTEQAILEDAESLIRLRVKPAAPRGK